MPPLQTGQRAPAYQAYLQKNRCVHCTVSTDISILIMASKEALKFVVFLGTVREGNYGSRAAKFVVRKLEEKGYSVTLLGKIMIYLCLVSVCILS